MAGQQSRLQRESAKQKSEQEKAELEQRKKENEERIKLGEAELKQRSDEFTAKQALEDQIHKIAILQAKQKLGEDVSETGALPEGAQLTGTQFDPTGQYPTNISFEHPLLGKMTVEHPEARIFRKGQESEAIEAPKRLTRTQVADIQSETRKTVAQETIEGRKQLQEAKLEADKAEAQFKLAGDIQLAHIKGNYALKARQLTADKIKALPQAQQNKITDFNLLENKTQVLKQMLESNGGYERFYKGKLVGGTVADIGAAFGGDPETEKIRQLSAEIEADAKNMIGKFGGALTRTELNILENMAPSPNRNITPIRAQAIVNGFLLGVQNIKGEYADQVNRTVKPNTTTTETQTKKVNRIRVDEKGNPR